MPLASLLVALLPATAAAAVGDPCLGGKMVVDDAGHCCWEQQGWSPALQACVGPPRCPSGMWRQADTCVEEVKPRESALFDDDWRVAVRFVADRAGDQFEIAVDDEYAVACSTPCELRLSRGRHRVFVKGAAAFRQKIDVRDWAGEVRVERRSGPMLALGVASITVGALSAIVGSAFFLVGNSSSYFDTASERAQRQRMRDAGIPMTIGGAVVAVVGGIVGLSNKGHNRMVLEPARGSTSQAAGLRLEGVAVSPVRGGAVAGASFAF
ncbi:MAG: hypothetical protein QM765_11110 [Myxococcales bacterium]